jgi:ribosomal protein S6--L-glutamate ligase
MILSFHPCYEADVNLIVAGQDPGKAELAAIRAADAVILPQGCRQALYHMAVENCDRVFPDYRARFEYPGKTGQAALFQKLRAPFPPTVIYRDLADFHRQYPRDNEDLPLPLPFVFKFNWGGEGQAVSLISSRQDFDQQLDVTNKFEKSGRSGFVLQQYVPHGNRSLRVVVINRWQVSYWRVQPNPQAFGTSLASGARLETDVEPALQNLGKSAVQKVCAQTGINLAGFDVIFDRARPFLLEINYFFGRTGLGGSDAFYRVLISQIDAWLAEHRPG